MKENAEEKLENYPEKGDLRGRSRKVVVVMETVFADVSDADRQRRSELQKF